MATSFDYPFADWTTYFKILDVHLSAEDYEEEYPKYYNYHDEGGMDLAIVDDLLAKGQAPQEGLNKFLSSILAGSIDVVEEMEDEIAKTIALFFEKGACAAPCADQLFKATHPENVSWILDEDTMEDFESEVDNYGARSMMIDILAKYDKIDVSLFGKRVKATYWEDIPKGKYTIEQARLMHLKQCSQYLQFGQFEK